MNKLRPITILLVIIPVIAILAIYFFGFHSSSIARNEMLVIYTFEKMIPQEISASFEKDTGIKIVYRYFQENEEMLDELVRTDGREHDLVIADDYIFEFVTHPAWNLAQKLDKSKIRNIGNIDPLFQHQFYDPLDEYTIPYGAGIQTIVYDPAMVQLDIRAYADLWDDSLRNSVGITGNYRVINGMALKVLDKSYNTNVIADIRNAGERLNALAPNIRIIKDFGLEQDMIGGRVSAAVMYTDQVTKSKRERPELKIVFPIEGIGFGIMPAFIPAGAPNADAAHRFLDYILDPERGARCFEYSGYYCTFEASKNYIDPKEKEFLIVPGFGSFEMIQNVSQEAEDEHSLVWAEFIRAVSN